MAISPHHSIETEDRQTDVQLFVCVSVLCISVFVCMYTVFVLCVHVCVCTMFLCCVCMCVCLCIYVCCVYVGVSLLTLLCV